MSLFVKTYNPFRILIPTLKAGGINFPFKKCLLNICVLFQETSSECSPDVETPEESLQRKTKQVLYSPLFHDSK